MNNQAAVEVIDLLLITKKCAQCVEGRGEGGGVLFNAA